MKSESGGSLRDLPADDRATVLDSLISLVTQFLPSAGLPEPHFLFLDNSILQDLLKREVHRTSALRTRAVLLFADFLVHHSQLRVEVALPPAILYEFAQRVVPHSESEWIVVTRNAHQCLLILGMPIRSFGASSFAEGRAVLSDIVHDESVIAGAVSAIKVKDWTVALRDGSRMTMPLPLSYRLVPQELKLKYFDLTCVRAILASLIERRILENRQNDAHVRRTFRNKDVGVLGSLNRLKKGVLQGLGDIELLAACSINRQFQQRQDHTCTALSFDETLNRALALHKSRMATHEPIQMGDDSSEEIRRKFAELSDGIAHLNKVAERQDAFGHRVAQFIEAQDWG